MTELERAKEIVHHCEYRNPGEAEHAVAVATIALAEEQRTANLIALAALELKLGGMRQRGRLVDIAERLDLIEEQS